MAFPLRLYETLSRLGAWFASARALSSPLCDQPLENSITVSYHVEFQITEETKVYVNKRFDPSSLISSTVRDLRGHPGQVWDQRSREHDLILTSNGKPIAILSSVSEDSLEESLARMRQGRAVTAVEKMQSRSLREGKDKLSLAEINQEIRAVRKSRRR